MDKSLTVLCEAIKKVILLLPTAAPLSFLILSGKMKQGKTSLLKQSHLKYVPIDGENEVHLFYNHDGIILEIGETWLNQRSAPLSFTLKRLNRCHKKLKISGLLLTIDCQELFHSDPLELHENCRAHVQILERFGKAIGYPLDTAIFFTKLDVLAGFCEFFQSDSANDLKKPLGFSLDIVQQDNKLLSNYKVRFDHFLESLGQEILTKVHPARSSAKRSLIREFPLQLSTLRIPIQTLLQKIPVHYFRVQSLYFTSAEQGGLSQDRLNQKIEHTYALALPNHYPQSSNFRSYFIEGAIAQLQIQTQGFIHKPAKKYSFLAGAALAGTGIILTCLVYQHWQTSQLLDETSKELLAYETLINQAQNNTAAFYHLSLAQAKLNAIPGHFFPLPLVKELKLQLHKNTQEKLQHNFLPTLISRLEAVMSDAIESPLARYHALKIYLMLTEAEHFSQKEIIDWFVADWQKQNPNNLDDKPIVVLKNALRLPLPPIEANKQIIIDMRNYLNALPASYLYYSLAKAQFPQHVQPIAIEGFSLSARELPYYYTKAGFKEVMDSLAYITTSLQQENWILQRQDLDTLQIQLEQAYFFEYAAWWKNFINNSHPEHSQGFQQSRQLMKTLVQNKSIPRLIDFIQSQTKPEPEDILPLFNKKIAPQFTMVNLITPSASNELMDSIHEFEQFLTTLSLVHDDGTTLFNLTKSRFQGNSSDPLSKLYQKANQLPAPISLWAKQVSDDSWYLFIHASKQYLNRQWQKNVFQTYLATIANRYPVDSAQKNEINIADFDRFFSPQGSLNHYVNNYLKPFLDTSQPQWQAKELNGFMLPISNDLINELIRANIISNMFFPSGKDKSNIDFSLQKINLDPVVAKLELTLGKTTLTDTQGSESFSAFNWPQSNAKLSLQAIDGQHFSIEENGVWAFFRMLQKVNVLVDNNDSSSLQILFEVNGNSGRYLLKTENQINPFSPGVLTGFILSPNIA